MLKISTIHPSIHCSMSLAPVGVQSPLTSSLGEFLGYWALVSWAFARVVVHRPPLRLPYLGVFYTLVFTSHWISFVYFSRWLYLHPTTNPSSYSRLGTGTMVIGYPKRLRYHGGGVRYHGGGV